MAVMTLDALSGTFVKFARKNIAVVFACLFVCLFWKRVVVGLAYFSCMCLHKHLSCSFTSTDLSKRAFHFICSFIKLVC